MMTIDARIDVHIHNPDHPDHSHQDQEQIDALTVKIGQLVARLHAANTKLDTITKKKE